MVVGALNRRRGESNGGRPPYSWQITKDFAEWVIAAEIFEKEKDGAASKQTQAEEGLLINKVQYG